MTLFRMSHYRQLDIPHVDVEALWAINRPGRNVEYRGLGPRRVVGGWLAGAVRTGLGGGGRRRPRTVEGHGCR
ncbi:MAG: hypothetical protein U5L11_03575 [Arhodomonas sp.]|nr:hypothetical protein [Arhodomonas sp.]